MDRPPLRQYLVERYVPEATEQDLREIAQRLTRAAEELAAAGETVRYLGTTFVPVEESCFSWFEGQSEEAVRRVLDAVAVPYARILAADAVRP